jgi:hypothetical protein
MDRALTRIFAKFLTSMAGVCALVVGCSKQPEEVFTPVSGTVTLDGKPLPIGWISFYPDTKEGNQSVRIPYAEIQKDGTYDLTPMAGKIGASPGKYRVVVMATYDRIPLRAKFNPDGTMVKEGEPRWLHHSKYLRANTTPLKVEVVEKPAPGAYDFNLTK